MSDGSFFPPVENRGAPEDADQDEPWMTSAWDGPDRHTRPGLHPLSLVLGRSTTTAVLIEGVRAYLRCGAAARRPPARARS